MKRMFLIAACALMALTACDPAGSGGKGESWGTLGPDDQKAKIETTKDELINTLDASAYNDLMRTTEVLAAEIEALGYNEDYDFSEVELALEDMADEFYNEEYIGGDSYYVYNIFLANAKGLVTFGPDKATYEDYDGTKVVFPSVAGDGSRWEAELKQSGTVTTMDFGEFVDESYYDYVYNPETDEYEYNPGYHTEVSEITIGVPEKVTAEITRNGEAIATVTISLDINMDPDDIYIEDGELMEVRKGSISISYTVQVDDLVYSIEDIAYDVQTGVLAYKQSLKKNGQLILSASVSGTAKLDYENEDYTAKNLNLNVDIMGRIQVKGSCPNAKTIADKLEEADPQSEKELEQFINEINGDFDLNVYYDGKSTVEAKVELDPYVYVYDDGGKYYGYDVVVVFPDGSRYLIYEFYSEEEAERYLIDFEDFIYSYVDLFNSYFEHYCE